MKKLLIALTMVSFVAACKNGGASWSAADKQQWMQTCTAEMGQMDANSAKNYCSCMLDKIEQKYKSYAEMNTKGTSQDGVDAGKACLGALKNNGNNNNGGNGGNGGGNGGGVGNILGGNNNGGNGGGGNTGGGWSAADEQSFLNNCVKNATNAGADQQTSNTHCNCVLKKIEAKYSSLSEANRLATKPEVDAMEQECLQERTQNNQ